MSEPDTPTETLSSILGDATVPISRAAVERRRQSRRLADDVVELFVEDMTSAAARKGGVLTIHDIVSLGQDFKRKTPFLQSLFERSFDEYVRARERAAWDKIRHNAFDRMVVQNFAHLFPHRDHAGLPQGSLSRRVLPGFFLVVNMMLGTEAVDAYQDQCEQVVARLKETQDDAFDWHKVYQDPEARRIVRRALVGMAVHFDQTDRRAGWFIDIVNRHLAPPHFVAHEGDDGLDWQLDENTFWRIVDALFADLGASLRDAERRDELVRACGEDTLQTVAGVIDRVRSRVIGLEED